MLRASAVRTSICGCTIVTNNSGEGRVTISNGKMDRTNVTPPKIHGAILSACFTPDATFSPFMAKRTKSSLENIFPNK